MPSGGLMQLVSYGVQDIYFPGNNVINMSNTSITLDTSIPLEWEYVNKKLDSIENCPVTFNDIEEEYICCSVCNKIFDIEVKEMWIDIRKKCPHCRQEWSNYVIYKNN
jgi:hypothetical protein